MSADDLRRHRIIDYDVRSHGTTETTVQQSERLILDALHRLADEWDEGFIDHNGTRHNCDLTLIDKGWIGNWMTEDGETKTWTSRSKCFAWNGLGICGDGSPARGNLRIAHQLRVMM